MGSLEGFKELIDQRIKQWSNGLPSGSLYAPMSYLMGLPAKRIRPAMLLMSAEMFGADPRTALDEALGIELFHNFTLMHDDIMDEAPLRRGHTSVHHKWSVNAAILSGDAMFVKASELMRRNMNVAKLFDKYSLLVCEGQQLDMDFESDDNVSVEQYLEMIRCKTAALLSCSLLVGAVIADAPVEDQKNIAAFGEHLGMAFQLRDDLLDAFGDMDRVGKQRGGDLRAGKKTYLLIKGLQVSSEDGRSELLEELDRPTSDRDVQLMLKVLEELGVDSDAQRMVQEQNEKALSALAAVDLPKERKQVLETLAGTLLDRVY